MAQKLPKQTAKVGRNTAWPFPTKLLNQEPKKVKAKKPNTTQYEEATF